MATYRITGPDGGQYDITAPDDATQEQVLAYAQAKYAGAPAPDAGPGAGAGQQHASRPVQPPASTPKAKRGLMGELGHQVGLTARYALEGPAQLLDIVSTPVRDLITDPVVRTVRGSGLTLSDLVTNSTPKRFQSKSTSELFSSAADWLGLPRPEGEYEETVGAGARAMAGGGGAAGAARGASGYVVGQGSKAVLGSLAANPAAQIAGGAGGGVAGEVAKNAGLNEYGQLAASVAGGMAGGAAGNAAMKVTGRASEALGRRLGLDPMPEFHPKSMSDTQLSTVLRNRLSLTGGNWDAIPANVQKSLMDDLRKANSLDGLDARAMQRLADLRALGVTPTRGTVTLDPVQLTNEKNLAKAGANSNLSNMQGLAQVEHANNNRLIQVLQELEGGQETGAVTAGRTLSTDIAQQRDALRSAEEAAWRAAKADPAYRMPMQAHVLGEINAALDDAGLMPFMDARISAYIHALQTNPENFTPQAYRNLQSMLSNAMRAGGNEAAAAGAARDALERAAIRPAASQIPNPGGLPTTSRTAQQMRATDPMPGNAMEAVDSARQATRAAYSYEDSSPLVRSALSDGASADPTRLAQRFVINGTADEAAEVARNLTPEGLRVMRNAIATHIKKAALNGSADEVGKISQKSLNSAINALGPEKLGLFFSPAEVQQLQRVGRVASYIQVQPAGSAVNNSNSGTLMLGKGLNALLGITNKLPFLNIDQQIDSFVSAGRTSNALRAGRSLLAPTAPEYGVLSNTGRGAAMGGLLAIPEDSERTKDNKGN